MIRFRAWASRLLLVSAIAMVICSACTIPEPAVEPETRNPALIEELAAYLEPSYGNELAVDYELLREVPTQVGVATPKYYVWLTARQGESVVVEGAARIAAIDADEFTVTHFVSQPEIVADPEPLTRIFPAALIPDIEARANSLAN